MRNSRLAQVCFVLFAVFLAAQALTGWRAHDADQTQHGEPRYQLWPATSPRGHFVEATFENWESEFLQMGAFVLLTAFLVQKGSAESKKEEGDPPTRIRPPTGTIPDAPWPVRRGGSCLRVYENSLLIAFAAAVPRVADRPRPGRRAGSTAPSRRRTAARRSAWSQYVTTSQFWFESFQNWQSEFLAVAAIVVLTIFLRQRGSPESKPVHAPHAKTGSG